MATGCTLLGTGIGAVATVFSPGSISPGVPVSPFLRLPRSPGFLDLLANNLVVAVIVAFGVGVLTALTLFLIGVPLGIELVRNPYVLLAFPHGVFEFTACGSLAPSASGSCPRFAGISGGGPIPRFLPRRFVRSWSGWRGRPCSWSRRPRSRRRSRDGSRSRSSADREISPR